MQEFDAILQKWKNEQQDDREVYHRLYKSVREFDEHIKFRYDGKVDYLLTVAGLLVDKFISEGDIAAMNANVQEAVKRMAGC